jgi:predicted ATPase
MIAQQYDDLPLQDQQVLEAASVAGQTCSAAAVAAGLEAEVEAVEARGAALVRRGQFLEASGLEYWPDGTVAERYRWRHTLYQEVIYARAPAGRRLRLHQRIGQREEAGYGAQASARAAALAEHFVRGRDDPRAVQYLQQAAQNALQRYAYREAIGHLTRGLTLLQALPATPERLQQELAMQATLGMALMTLQGYSAPDVERAYTRARTLAHEVEETPHLFPVLWGLWAFSFVRGELQIGYGQAEQLLSLAHRVHDPALLLEAHMAMGANMQHLGEVVAARTHLEQALTLFDPQQHRAHAFVYGHDPQVVGLADLACILWVLGYPDQAREQIQEALAVGQTVDHAYSRALAHFFTAWCAQLCHDPLAAATQAAVVLTLAHEHAFQYLVAMSLVLQGWAIAMQGQTAEGIAQMRQGLAAQRVVGAEINRPLYLALLAEVYGHVGQVAVGLQTLDEALAVMQQHSDHFYEAEVYRLQGTLWLRQAVSNAVQAEACFHQALAVARRQQAKSLELQAAMSLSRLWQQQGKRDDAYALLAPIYSWFTEGFDTADLQEARALLEAWTG